MSLDVAFEGDEAGIAAAFDLQDHGAVGSDAAQRRAESLGVDTGMPFTA